MSKAEVLGASCKESGAATVSPALAEATVQNETKDFFLEDVFDLDEPVKLPKETN